MNTKDTSPHLVPVSSNRARNGELFDDKEVAFDKLLKKHVIPVLREIIENQKEMSYEQKLEKLERSRQSALKELEELFSEI